MIKRMILPLTIYAHLSVGLSKTVLESQVLLFCGSSYLSCEGRISSFFVFFFLVFSCMLSEKILAFINSCLQKKKKPFQVLDGLNPIKRT